MSALGNSLRRRLALGSKADFFIEEISGSNITQSDIEGWLGGYVVIGFENNNGIIRFRLRQIGTPSGNDTFNNIHLKLKNVTILNSSYLFPQRYAVLFAGSVNSVFTLQENLSSLGLSFRSASNLKFYFSNQINVVNFGNSFQDTALEKIIIFNKLTQLSNGNSNQHGAFNCRYFSANKAVLLENQQGLTLSGDTFITRGEYENTPSGVNQQLDYIRNQFNNVIYAQNYTLPSPPTNIQQAQVGGTYAELDQTSFPSHVNNYFGVLVFEDNFFFGFFENNLLFALTPETSYNFKIRLVDEFFNISEPARFSVLTPALPALFQNAVAYWKLGNNNIDLINGYNGTEVGTGITRDGEYVDFGTNGAYIEIPDNDDFSFVDSNGDNTDFVIKTEIRINQLNSSGFGSWLVSKRNINQAGISEWQIWFNSSGVLSYNIFNDSNSTIFFPAVSSRPTLAINTDYTIVLSKKGNTMRYALNGVVFYSETLDPSFQMFNGNSPVQLGNASFSTNLNDLKFMGKTKETTILKGQGWDEGEISDNYNNGNGTTI